MRHDDPTKSRSEQTRRGEPPAVLNVDALLGGRREVRISHRGQEYRLQVTRQNKLILTK